MRDIRDELHAVSPTTLPLEDPWGNPYLYGEKDGEFVVAARGPNGVLEALDDYHDEAATLLVSPGMRRRRQTCRAPN